MSSEDKTRDSEGSDGASYACTLKEDSGTSRKRDLIIAVALILFIVVWTVFLLYHPPEEIVGFLGVNNTYMVVFLLAATGGVSAFTSTSFYTALITISLGGVDPIYLALFASVGLTLGDIVFYFVGKKGRQCFPQKYERYINMFFQLVEKVSDRTIIAVIFFYSLTPLPSDILAIVLAILGFPLKKIVPPLLIGNFALILVLAELARYGYRLF
ncbi:VTT domain-containing protein [Methanolobus halotolerans]|uniref:DedA family protein n=1 Tax=Methanolobus halotolerans TaxID=2052935 RepID=A0A4E0PSB8_9EURY|nr:VTT domain-containing protein [Methanolobus halotolerans]TGC06654.1 hypothetical protein CUN85_12730 [Methanolobus halotolerans]